ncbi:hypothetical protein FB563_6484 [Streptomyces puniciscabiei]|uniref:Secreted protein n=1 Tax=Streptomyces puniciscabiei TaxID=164348 RepID=A0A542THQ1_9ACTN|nr:hypothetical protein [Streptomyces puniciscabiei]TQK86356.1 hypothetical protein FB563_6484 [Streptomyces puniciscabiei]
MKVPRSTVVTAGLAAAAALAATGITYASAAPAPTLQSAPAAVAAAPLGGDSGQGKGNEGREGREGREGDWGRILINERSYSAHPGDCITVVSGLGAKSFNIRNETRKTVEVFRGAVCDNGAPIATVGPHSSSEGVRPCPTDGIHVKHGVVASFRVVRHHGGGDWD